MARNKKIDRDIKFRILEKKAVSEKNSVGYNVNWYDFNFLRGYGFVETENQPTIDNCYVHRLKTTRQTLFRLITKEKVDFSVPF